jgi:hypothetical protein
MIFTDSPKSQYVYTDLTGTKERLNQAKANSQTNVGTGTTIVAAYVVPAAALDNVVLGKLQIINSKKAEIAAITKNNFIQYKNGGGGCGIGTSTNFSSDVVVGSSKTTTYYDCSSPTDRDTCSVIATGLIVEDSIYGYVYPSLENNNTSSTFYSDGATYQKITSSNLGIGLSTVLYTDIFDPNGTNAGSASSIGTYYLTASGGSCTGTLSSITSITNEINVLRAEVNTMLSGINALKGPKTNAQIDRWYDAQSINVYDGQLADVTSAISSMETNQSVIVNYEAANP